MNNNYMKQYVCENQRWPPKSSNLVQFNSGFDLCCKANPMTNRRRSRPLVSDKPVPTDPHPRRKYIHAHKLATLPVQV